MKTSWHVHDHVHVAVVDDKKKTVKERNESKKKELKKRKIGT